MSVEVVLVAKILNDGITAHNVNNLNETTLVAYPKIGLQLLAARSLLS